MKISNRLHHFVKKFKIEAVCLILWSLFLFSSGSIVSAQTLPKLWTKGTQVRISVSLGQPILRLWGYGPSDSRIELTGNGVSDFTYAGTNGYFEFAKTFLPAPTDFFYPELCLTAIDLTGRATPPTCIPPLPVMKFDYDIGPVILPPTISLGAGSTAELTQTEASGITIPNSEVKIVLAEGGGAGNLAEFSIVRLARAYYIPDYTIKSDSRGHFSFNMPAVNPDNWRVFAVTNYSQGATSPKSNTLTFRVISPTTVAIQNIWRIILSFMSLPGLIIMEIFVILVILVFLFWSKINKIRVSPNASKEVKENQNQSK